MTNKDRCEKAFAHHVGKIILNTDEFFIADYQDEEGSIEYYVNYVMDKRRGMLMITGDLGTCVMSLDSPMSPKKLNQLIHNNAEYFIGKIQCSTDMFVDDFNEVVEAIRMHINFSSADAEFIRYEVQRSWDGDLFVPTQELLEIIREHDSTCDEWLTNCGRHIAPRVYMWLYGFNEVCKLIT